ncbi:alkaline phosphatase [Shewanella sp. OPT22]|nr:alkaline phosphatase [Shewanella sp. OPT22]
MLNQTIKGLMAIALLAPLSVLAANETPTETPKTPKNIIYIIGDGMGPAYTTAYRYYKDNPNTEEVETTVFDRLLVGMARTAPARMSGYVTDSAAAATALSTGVKTYNGAIGMDTDKRPMETLLEKAKKDGKAIGITVTSQVNHATPASFLSHNESRKNYEQIAEDYLDSGADVIMGGGQRYFDKNLLAQFKKKGYQVLENFDKLNDVHSGKVLGLFADVQLPWVIDNPNGHQLSKMTQKSLELLSQHNDGFVLLIEGSIIDWAGHANDIATTMGEMDEFARTLEVVETYIRKHPDTLMVATADHDTGGLTVGANNKKSWNPGVLHKIKASPMTIAKQLISQKQWKTGFAKLIGFEPKDNEWKALTKAHSQDEQHFAMAIIDLVNKRSNTGWTTDDHTAVDVQVFAKGPASQLFVGSQENTEIADTLSSLL